MVLGTQEIILIVIVVIILFGASKIPELARSLGKATGEFKKAKQETEHELKEVEKSVKESPQEKSSKIKQMARDMEIEIEGKSDEQLLDEIQKKTVSITARK